MGIYNMSRSPQQIIFISNHEITAHKNSANSYDSNGIKYMRIRGLYEDIRNLPGFLFTRMKKHLIGRFWSYETYVISLERYSHDEFSAVGIT